MLSYENAFPGQEQREAVFVFARPYFIAFIPTALVFLAIYLSSFIFQLGVSRGWFPYLLPEDANAIIFFVGLFQLLSLIVFLTATLDFYYDILIVTDRRLVDINQEQLFFRRISELNLEDIEDVSSSVQGFFGTLFNFGTVLVQTAGTHENFEAVNFRHPREIAAIISDLANQAKDGVPQSRRLPASAVLGVINDQQVQSMDELKQAGAIREDDARQRPTP